MSGETIALAVGSLCALRFLTHVFVVFSTPDPTLPSYLRPGYRSKGFVDKLKMAVGGIALFAGAWIVSAQVFDVLIWWLPREWGFEDSEGYWTSYRTYLQHFAGFWGGLYGVSEIHKVPRRLRRLADQAERRST